MYNVVCFLFLKRGFTEKSLYKLTWKHSLALLVIKQYVFALFFLNNMYLFIDISSGWRIGLKQLHVP